MKRKSDGQASMNLEKAVALTDDEVATKSTRIRTLLREVKGLKTEVKDATRRNRKRIAECDAEIEHEMELIDQGIELRKQGSLFAKDEAQKALATVAAVAGEPKPSEAHAFDGAWKECGICGAEKSDPIHGNGKSGAAYEFDTSEPAPNVIRTHAAVDRADRKRARVLNRKARSAEKGGRV